MFPVFHLAWSTWPATKTFVAGWRKLLRKVERGSTLSKKFWFCCSFFTELTTCRATNLLVPYKSTNQCTAVLQLTTNVFVAGQVDQARWKMRNIDQNLQWNNVARQVEGFCISYFAALTDERSNIIFDYIMIWKNKNLKLKKRTLIKNDERGLNWV